jgi:hypothetical protein
VDQAVVPAGQRRPVETERIEHTGRPVEDRDVGAGNQTLRLGEVVGTMQVQRQPCFVSVPRQVARLGAAALGKGRVDLDHLCAQVGEVHGRHRRREVTGEVENPYPHERRHQPRSAPPQPGRILTPCRDGWSCSR